MSQQQNSPELGNSLELEKNLEPENSPELDKSSAAYLDWVEASEYQYEDPITCPTAAFKEAERRIGLELSNPTSKLDLRGLLIQDLPPCLAELTSLKVLMLGGRFDDHCPLTTIEPINQLPQLTHLCLEYCSIQSIACLSGAGRFRYLNLGGNVFSDLTELADFTQLQTLNLSRTNVCHITDLDHLTQLQHLYFTGSKINQISGLDNLTQLQTLALSHTDIDNITGLSQLTNLRSLDLTRTKIEQIAGLDTLTQLQTLVLSDTHITLITGLDNLCQLQHLDLSHTEVEQISGLDNLNQLQTLNLPYTNIEQISGLDNLSQLQTLNLYQTKVEQISGLDNLSQLQTLNLSHTKVEQISGLDNLSQLQTLNLSHTKVGQISGLDNLSQLQTLELSETNIEQISGLDNLSQLQTLELSYTKVEQISGFENLIQLLDLNLRATPIQKISGLDNLLQLQTLDLSHTKIEQISGLAHLTQLQSLRLSYTQIEQISDLENLTQLQSLSFTNTGVKHISGLAHLTQLKFLRLSYTKVEQISGLDNLTQLLSLVLEGLNLKHFSESLLHQSKLEHLNTYESQINNIPTALLSNTWGDNCLPRIRHYFNDLKAGCQPLNDIKLMVLGNGQIGKTQICRRLCGLPFDADIASTHGVLIEQAQLEMPGLESLTLNLWDFGGQEIYHGTHSLFFNSQQTVFLLLWLPEAENQQTHTVDNMQFRNHPLDYWLEHIYQQNKAVKATTVIIAQAQCDEPQDGESRLPVIMDTSAYFPFVKVITSSAKSADGLDELMPALRKAIGYNQQHYDQQQMPNAWLRVKQQLQQWIAQDNSKPQAQRTHRLLSQQHFTDLCLGKDQPSLTPDLRVAKEVTPTLLHLLHHSGVIFYKKGLFNDQILLDQNWALNAIYGVFHRQTALHPITANKGIFCADDLALWLWNDQGYSVEEQQLFLQMMESCGVCFSYSHTHSETKSQYVVPELLPKASSRYIRGAIERNWQDKDSLIESQSFVVDLLHNTLFNRILALIGRQAGEGAVYWNNGLLAYESEHKSWLRFEREMTTDWQGTLTLSTRGGNANGLLKTMIGLIEKQQRHWSVQLTANKSTSTAIADSQTVNFEHKLPEVCISYKWNDKTAAADSPENNREQVVELFCQAAEERGIRITRDRNTLRLGDSLSAFMQRIGAGQRVIVILSDGYLKSAYCMFELYEIWRTSASDPGTFRQRVRVFRLPDLDIDDPLQCIQYSVFWKTKFEAMKALVEQHGVDVLGNEGFAQYKRIQQFYLQTNDMLHTIADTLGPQDINQLLEYGLAGLD